ncbi:MAG: inosine/xanthosine triphosphatase [Bacteroidota bacterium]
MTKKIIIASRNPVKITAVKQGYNKVFTNEKILLEGVSVASEVSDQPMSDAETLRGATNRANNAERQFPHADYWVGIEGGIQQQSDAMMAFAWVVIQSKSKVGKARTGTFFLPPKVVELIQHGKELGEADDIVFGHSNSKQKNGAVGLLTKNVIDRTSFYVEAVVLALIPFLNEELYA